MLRWRLLIGLVSIFILLIAVGGYSVWLIARLQKDINSLLTDNYECIRRAHNVRLTVLRLNATYLKPDVAETLAIGTEPLDTRFEPELENTITGLRLLSRSTESAENAKKLTAEVADFLQLFRKTITMPTPDQERYYEMRSLLTEKNLALTATTELILKANEQQMIEAQKRAEVLAVDTVRFLIGAMVIAVGVFIYTYYHLGKSLVTPIERLTRSIDAVREGRFEPDIPVKSNDELSRLARAFNAMAGELRVYRQDTDETILRLNRSLRETIAAFPYPVLLLDANFTIWVTNEAADAFLRDVDSPDELPDPISKHLEAVRRTRRNYLPDGPRDSILFRIGEREVHYLPRILRIFSPEGDFAGAAVILIDVSRFRWLDDMKTSLISTISHEIKTPLTGIRMMLHLLLEKSGGELAPMQTEMVQAACDDCERLLATLNSLLDLSRMEAGRTQLELQPVPPGELLEEAREAFQTQADARRITLAVDVADDLPPVLADRARMAHVIGNFTSNALKFSAPHSIVRLTAERAGARFVRLSVIDSGPGVPDEYHARIFDKFFRPPGQRTDGVGLGLSIAREIVHAHEGRVGVHSQPHVATRFYCELPVV